MSARAHTHTHRSHECVPEGYEAVELGDGRALYTVFSATDYQNVCVFVCVFACVLVRACVHARMCVCVREWVGG